MKTRRELVCKMRILDQFVSDMVNFRDAIDLAFARTGQPSNRPLEWDELRCIVSELYGFMGLELDDGSYDSIWRKVKKEIKQAHTPSHYEILLSAALQKEIEFMEYACVARTLHV